LEVKRAIYVSILAGLIVLATATSSFVFGFPFQTSNDPVLSGNPEMKIDNTNAQAGSIMLTPTFSSQVIYSGSSAYSGGLCSQKITVNDEAGSISVRLVAFSYSVPIANLTAHQSVSFDAPGVNGRIVATFIPIGVVTGNQGQSSGTYVISTPVCQNQLGEGEVLMVVTKVSLSAGIISYGDLVVNSLKGTPVEAEITYIAGSTVRVLNSSDGSNPKNWVGIMQLGQTSVFVGTYIYVEPVFVGSALISVRVLG
jgi:hypothetical protein